MGQQEGGCRDREEVGRGWREEDQRNEWWEEKCGGGWRAERRSCERGQELTGQVGGWRREEECDGRTTEYCEWRKEGLKMDGNWSEVDGREEEEFGDGREEEFGGGRTEECCEWRKEEQEQIDGCWREEECGDGSEEEKGRGWREEEVCADGWMQQQGGVLWRRRWRCSCRYGWSSRCRAAAGWCWGCCGGEEQEEAVVWELRRRWWCFQLEEQMSCQQEQKQEQEEQEVCGRGQGPAKRCDWRRSCCRSAERVQGQTAGLGGPETEHSCR